MPVGYHIAAALWWAPLTSWQRCLLTVESLFVVLQSQTASDLQLYYQMAALKLSAKQSTAHIPYQHHDTNMFHRNTIWQEHAFKYHALPHSMELLLKHFY